MMINPLFSNLWSPIARIYDTLTLLSSISLELRTIKTLASNLLVNWRDQKNVTIVNLGSCALVTE